MNGPVQLDITISKGQDFSLPLQMFDDTNTDTPVSLAGAAVTAMIRNDFTDAAPIASFTCTVDDGPNGEFTVGMPGVTTKAIATDDPGPKKRSPLTKYLWDCQVVYSDGVTQRIIEGYCYIDPGATQ